MHTLETIHASIRRQTADSVQFGVVNVRIILRTGVNLKAIEARQNTNPALVRAVISALAELGFDVTKENGHA